MSEQIHAQKQRHSRKQDEVETCQTSQEAHAQEHHRQVVEDVETVLNKIDLVTAAGDLALRAA